MKGAAQAPVLFSPVPRELPNGYASTLFDEFMIAMSGVPSRIKDGMPLFQTKEARLKILPVTILGGIRECVTSLQGHQAGRLAEMEQKGE